MSTHTNDKGVELLDCGSSALHTTVAGQNVAKTDDSEPGKDDLQRLAELMDGFKASKVKSYSCFAYWLNKITCNE